MSTKSRQVVHFFRVIERPGRTITTTTCGRNSARTVDGLNSTDRREHVTCKFCLRALRQTPATT